MDYIKIKILLEQAMKAQRGRVEVLLHSFLNLGARWRWVVNATPRPPYPRERDPVPFLEEAGWAPGPVWTGEESLAPQRVLIPGPSSR